jgi:hypothetical protein
MRHTIRTPYPLGLALVLGAMLLRASTPLAAQRGPEQEQRNAFTWSGELAAGARLIARNLNGAVRVEASSGRTLEIVAHKRWRRGDPTVVIVEATRINNGRDVLLCAKWTPETECSEGGYRSRSNGGMRSNDVSVDFVIKLPAGAHLTAATVNGAVQISGVSGEVRANTINGSVEAESTSGWVMAETVNGNVRVKMTQVPERGAEYKTVNGSISVTLPSGLNATVEARTVNGSISTDFPVQVEGAISPRRLRGTVGTGGPRIEMSTVNGSIRLLKGS